MMEVKDALAFVFQNITHLKTFFNDQISFGEYNATHLPKILNYLNDILDQRILEEPIHLKRSLRNYILNI